MDYVNTVISRRALVASAIGLLMLPACTGPKQGGASPEPVAAPASQTAVTLLVGRDASCRRVAWRSDSADLAAVQWALCDDERSPQDGVDLAFQDAPASYVDVSQSGYYGYVAELSGLEPRRTYAYRVVNGGTVSETYSFETPGDADFIFAFVGDPQVGFAADDGARWAQLMQEALTAEGGLVDEPPAFLVTAGDNVNSAADSAAYDPRYEDWYAALSAPILRSVAFAPAIGNHEALHALYREYYPLLATQSGAQDQAGVSAAGADWWCTFNQVLLVFLNGCGGNLSSHAALIEAAVRQSGEAVRWKIAVIHHNLFSVCPDRSVKGCWEVALREALAPCLTEYGFDLVLSGHDHIYQRSFVVKGLEKAPDQGEDVAGVTVVASAKGPVYVSGNGSVSKFYDIPANIHQPLNAKVVQTGSPHFSTVAVSRQSLTMTTYDRAKGGVVDALELRKNG